MLAARGDPLGEERARELAEGVLLDPAVHAALHGDARGDLEEAVVEEGRAALDRRSHLGAVAERAQDVAGERELGPEPRRADGAGASLEPREVELGEEILEHGVGIDREGRPQEPAEARPEERLGLDPGRDEAERGVHRAEGGRRAVGHHHAVAGAGLATERLEPAIALGGLALGEDVGD